MILIRTVVQFMATKVRQSLIFFLATILNLFDVGTHQAEPKEALSVRWLLCERAAQGIKEYFSHLIDRKLLEKTQVTSVLYSAMKSNSASGEGSEVSSIGVTYFENNAKDKMRFC